MVTPRTTPRKPKMPKNGEFTPEDFNLENQGFFYQDLFSDYARVVRFELLLGVIINFYISVEYPADSDRSGRVKQLKLSPIDSRKYINERKYDLNGDEGTEYSFKKVYGTSSIFYNERFKIFTKIISSDSDLSRGVIKEDYSDYFSKLTESEMLELFVQKRKRVNINITKNVSFFDPIESDDKKINIEEYILENKDNIVIVYNKNDYFFTTRHIINAQKDDATMFPCLVADTMRASNVLTDKPLYDLKKIGFVYGYHCDMKQLFDNADAQLFAIVNTSQTYPSFISSGVFQRGASLVSGHHCQGGLDSRVSYIELAVPSTQDDPDGTMQTGGLRTKTRRQKVRKVRNKRKTKKTYNSKK
jgi:hypothetical protein